MTKRQIINLIKYNKQEKVKLTFNSQIHNLDEFVVYVSDKLELNEDELENYLTDEKKLDEDFKLDPENCFALVVPGVYEVSWAISGEELFEMIKETTEFSLIKLMKRCVIFLKPNFVGIKIHYLEIIYYKS
jgi:hypothetical protein